MPTTLATHRAGCSAIHQSPSAHRVAADPTGSASDTATIAIMPDAVGLTMKERLAIVRHRHAGRPTAASGKPCGDNRVTMALSV